MVVEDVSIINSSSFEKKKIERIVLFFWKLVYIWFFGMSSCKKKFK